MREFQERRKVRNILTSRPVLWLLAVLILWLIFAVVREYLTLRAAERSRAAAEAERSAMEEKVAAVRGNIGELDSDAGLEKIVRERFNVKKPGEELFIIVEEKAPEDAQKQTADGGFLHSLLAALKNIF